MVIENASENFPVGSIMKIVFHNFLTFDDLVFLPGPNLNVVIGPNGNGKSSVICGICLAVGGDPKILGRSGSIGDYVKHGCDKGFVELYIRDWQEKSDFSSRIVISQLKNSAEYFANGSSVTRSELRKVISSYNIQIENPCTFLAQDKVQSFAKQNPNLLLKNTEKASSLELFKLHELLEEMQENGAKCSSAHESLGRRAAAVVNELNSLESVVKNYEERKKALERVEILEKKIAFVDYNAAVALYQKRRSELAVRKEAAEQAIRALGSVENELEEKKKHAQQIATNVQALFTRREHLNDQLNTVLDETSVGSRIKQAREEYERVKKDCDAWENDIDMIKKEINSLTERLKVAEEECSLASVEMASTRKEYENWREKEEKVELQKNKINELQYEIRQGKEELESQVRKERQFEEYKQTVFENNALSKRLGCLGAWNWYTEHKSEFHHSVYVPLLSINLKSAENAKYLENVIAPRDYLMFIFGSKEDELRLTNSSFPWKISSTVMIPDMVAKNSVELGLPEYLREFGFRRMVSELYDAPAPVRAFLNNLFQLNKIPIGDANTDSRLEEVCSVIKDQYRLFLTGTSRVKINVSRYSGGTSIRTDSLKKNISWLVAHVPPDNLLKEEEKSQKLEILKNMETKVKEMQKVYDMSKSEINIAIEKLRRKMAELRKQVDSVSLVKQQLRSKEIRLKSLEENMPNLDEASLAMQKCKSIILNEGYCKAKMMAKLLEKNSQLMESLVVEKLTLLAVKKNKDNLSDKLDEYRMDAEKKKEEVNEFGDVIKNDKVEVVKCSEKLKLKAGINTTVETELSQKEKEILKKLLDEFKVVGAPDDRETLCRTLLTEKARLVAMENEDGKKALDRYQKLLEVHETLKQQLEGSSEQMKTWENGMDDLLNRWLTRLKELIGKINHNFDNFFRRLGCAGEVCLEEPPNKRDISAYGIDIMVKFRNNERLRRLTHQTQSGGERSVTTMLYLLALQELCPVPFRCVDEINQGMDPNNERKVFEMMVDLLSGVGNLAKTQYFLLTPKLLPGLHYGEKSVIHCIYNGVTFPEKSLHLAEYLRRAHSLTVQ